MVKDMVEHVDIFPTLLDLVRPGWSSNMDGLDGRSIVPLLQGRSLGESARPAYSEVHNIQAFGSTPQVRQRGEMYSLILDQMKFIHLPLNPSLDELYDLRNDSGELQNLIESKRRTADDFLADLRKREAIDHYMPDPSTLTPEERRHLKALGYLN